MNLEKIMNEFVDEYLSKGTYAKRDEIVALVQDVNKMLKEKKDATPEEYINEIVKDSIEMFDETINYYPIESYVFGLTTNKTNIQVYSDPQIKDKLFELNAMEMIIINGVINDEVKKGVISYDDKIKDLNPEFVNFGDITVRDVLYHKVKCQTDGRLDMQRTSQDAIEKLHTMQVEKLDEPRYSDLGYAVLKNAYEAYTGKKYADVAEEYIKSLGLFNDLHVKVPKEKYHLITNTPNAKYGKCNDGKSIILDPLYGAGGAGSLFGTSEDVNKLVMNAHKIIPDIHDQEYAYETDPNGVWEDTYVDTLEQHDTIGLHGRYTTEAIGNERGAYNVLLNSASIPFENAKKIESKINETRLKDGKNPLYIAKDLRFYDGKVPYRYKLVDSRIYLPIDEYVTERLINANAKAMIRLKFLEKVIESYDKNYLEKGINIEKVVESNELITKHR